jgi:hypothetical protein
MMMDTVLIGVVALATIVVAAIVCYLDERRLRRLRVELTQEDEHHMLRKQVIHL